MVEVKPKGGDWTEAATVPANQTEANVPHLKEGEEYQFRVRAVNEAGPGTPSTATGPVVAEKQPGWIYTIVDTMNSNILSNLSIQNAVIQCGSVDRTGNFC